MLVIPLAFTLAATLRDIFPVLAAVLKGDAWTDEMGSKSNASKAPQRNIARELQRTKRWDTRKKISVVPHYMLTMERNDHMVQD